eukprot:scaffold321083_cov45-Prasinocladus_malaysianus.AAC.2
MASAKLPNVTYRVTVSLTLYSLPPAARCAIKLDGERYWARLLSAGGGSDGGLPRRATAVHAVMGMSRIVTHSSSRKASTNATASSSGSVTGTRPD